MDIFTELAALNIKFWSLKRDIDRVETKVNRLIKKMPGDDDGSRCQQKWISRTYPELSRLFELSTQALSVEERIVTLLDQTGTPVPQEMRDSIAGIQKNIRAFMQVKEREREGEPVNV